jgi:hypothetical protein
MFHGIGHLVDRLAHEEQAEAPDAARIAAGHKVYDEWRKEGGYDVPDLAPNFLIRLYRAMRG